MPSTMRLLGEWNWWLPCFLQWLPNVTIEGDIDVPPDGSAKTPAPAGVPS